MTEENVSVTYENNIFYCTKDNTKWISVDGKNWYGEEKLIEELKELVQQREQRGLEVQEDLLKEKTDLEKELEKEKKLNAEIKARFVKCNTCTPDMKEKCLMFNENLCEGERCEELVDLMSLVEKRDHDDKLDKATQLLKRFVEWGNNRTNLYVDDILADTYSFLEEV